MTTAARGTVLAGRYRLEDRTHNSPDGAHWRAVDSTLDRRVSVRVMRPGHPFAAAAADAARRAALIDDPRLVRVLDVGQDGDVGFVVSEEVDGDTLAALVERSPLAPPAVRRIIGEVAEGLTAAAARGLHHLQLTPRSVIVGRDGSVKVAGTAVEAAATGLEPDHAASANRTDAVALVGLLYSGLTGRWPLAGHGFPPAPRGEGGDPVPPADLVPGIPNDLDTLCVVTLGEAGDGPLTPADLVAELTPWPSAEEAPLRAAPRRLSTDTPAGPPGPDSPLRFKSSPIRRGGFKPIRSATDPVVGTEAARAGRSASLFSSPAVAGSAPGPAVAGSAPGPAVPGSAPSPAVTGSAPGPAAAGSAPGPKEPGGAGPRRPDSLFTPQPAVEPDAEPDGGGARAEPQVTAPALSLGLTRDPSSAIRAIPPIMTGRPAAYDDAPAPEVDEDPIDEPSEAESGRTEFGRTPPGRTEFPSGEFPRPERRGFDRSAATPGERPGPWNRQTGPNPMVGASPPPPGEPLVPWGPGWANESGPPSALEATGPFPILIPPEAPPREQSRLVIFAVTVALVLGLVVAAFSLRDLGSSNDDVQPQELGAALPSTTAAPEATTSPATTPSPTPSATPSNSAASVPPTIAKIKSIDPQGNGDENTDKSPLAVDGKAGTFWNSMNYTSAEFGSLKKGVGLALKLKKTAAVSSVTIDFNGSGGAVEVRTGNGTDLTSSTRVGRATMRNGRVTVTTDDAKPSKYVILWFTKLSSVNGQHKLEVSEVRLK